MTRFTVEDKSCRDCTATIRQPGQAIKELLQQVAGQVAEKETVADRLRIAVRTPHRGPLRADPARRLVRRGWPGDRPPGRLHERAGLTRRGKHHEIYLSDIRRADPAKWKTILRQPVAISPHSARPVSPPRPRWPNLSGAFPDGSHNVGIDLLQLRNRRVQGPQQSASAAPPRARRAGPPQRTPALNRHPHPAGSRPDAARPVRASRRGGAGRLGCALCPGQRPPEGG